MSALFHQPYSRYLWLHWKVLQVYGWEGEVHGAISTILRSDVRRNESAQRATDSVDGVVDLIRRTNEVCNQALVFMARGLTANWKQLLGFFFSSNAASSQCLRELLLTVLHWLDSCCDNMWSSIDESSLTYQFWHQCWQVIRGGLLSVLQCSN